MKSDLNLPYIIRYVSFPVIRLTDHTGQYHQNIRADLALKMARENGLDLVCFNKPDIGTLAFCKILDFGKWKYEEEKKKKKNEKAHKKENKEIRFTPNIAENDIAHKTRQINEFLDAGDDVLLVMKLRGRECLHMAEAEIKMNQIVSFCTSGKELNRKKTGNIIFVRMAKHGAVKEEKTEELKPENIKDDVQIVNKTN